MATWLPMQTPRKMGRVRSGLSSRTAFFASKAPTLTLLVEAEHVPQPEFLTEEIEAIGGVGFAELAKPSNWPQQKPSRELACTKREMEKAHGLALDQLVTMYATANGRFDNAVRCTVSIHKRPLSIDRLSNQQPAAAVKVCADAPDSRRDCR